VLQEGSSSWAEQNVLGQSRNLRKGKKKPAELNRRERKVIKSMKPPFKKVKLRTNEN